MPVSKTVDRGSNPRGPAILKAAKWRLLILRVQASKLLCLRRGFEATEHILSQRRMVSGRPRTRATFEFRRK